MLNEKELYIADFYLREKLYDSALLRYESSYTKYNGFGYDPIFLLNELGLTMAELTTEVKNSLSHRARALQAARPMLTILITPGV